MSDFCKLFDTERGQILVKIDRNAEGDPEVRFFAQPEGLGVCTVAAGYEDNDAGWDKAEDYFARVDSAKAIEATQVLWKMSEAVHE